MPRRARFSDLPTDLPDERAQMALAVRTMIEETGLPYRSIERELRHKAESAGYLRSDGYLTRSVLSCLANGQRKRAPRARPLRGLHELAVENSTSPEAVLAWTELEALLLSFAALRTEAAIGLAACVACGTACVACKAAALPGKLGSQFKPAGIASPLVAPVPPSEGDRRNRLDYDIAWPAARDLAGYILVDDLERANGLIRHVSIEAPPAETADAVAACRDLELHEATDAIIRYAGQRPDRDVLEIVRSLNQRERRAEADTLLDHALTDTATRK